MSVRSHVRRLAIVMAMLAASEIASGQEPAAPRRTIADALANRGTDKAVTVRGRATVSTGKMQGSAFEIAIEDSTGGVRLFSRLPQPDVREGDSLEATGTIKAYRGDLELMATTITVYNAPSRAVVPREVVIEGPVIAPNAGRLVRVRGRVAGMGHSEGGQWLRMRDASPNAHGTITVWVPANHGAPIDLTAAGAADSLVVTGIVSAYQDNPDDPLVWQIMPRDAHDVQISDRRAAIPSAILWAALALTMVVGAWLWFSRIGARKQLHDLRETEQRYQQLLALLPDAVIVHANGTILFSNPAASKLLGVPPEKGLVGRALADFVDQDSLGDLLRRTSGPVGAAEPPRTARAKMITATETNVDVEVASSPCVYHDSKAMLLLARDITGQLRYERDLHALALVDELTGLQNRRAFTLFAEQELARARRNGRTPLLVFADLDGLKQINDQYGHAAGDSAIRLVANALRSIFRETDVVARWSGDEFVALMVDGSTEASQMIGARLDAAIAVQSPPRQPYVVTASVGASALDPNLPLRDAMERADAELYAQKKRNRRSKIRVTPMGVDVIPADE